MSTYGSAVYQVQAGRGRRATTPWAPVRVSDASAAA